MEKRLFQQLLDNGVSVECTDTSRHYYGGFHQVSIEVECMIDVLPELFPSEEHYITAAKVLGNRTSFKKVLSRMAVPSAHVDEVRQELVDTFMSHNMKYIDADDFPLKLVQSNLVKNTKAGRGSCGPRSSY